MPFQFLIGRLGTVREEDLPVFEEAFQFLIGRLGTLTSGGHMERINCFNSS